VNALALPDIGYFHVGSLLTLVYPNYYGLLSGSYFGPGDSTQHYFYAGILLVPLVILGVRNTRVLRMALVLSVPFVWYAWGPAGGLYRLVARLPGFRSVELPMHGWFLPALALALLGGAGMVVVERRIGSRWSLALTGLMLADVLVVNQLLNPLAYARTGVEQEYGQTLEAFGRQVAAAQPPVERVYGPPMAEVGYRNHALQSRMATTYGYNPLELAAYAAYTAAAESDPRLVAGLAPSHRLVDDDEAALQPVDDRLPLATFVTNPVVVADDAEATQRLADGDPRTGTLVVGPLPPVEADPSPTAAITAQGLDSLEVHYASRTPNLLRVAIPNYPGWQAVDVGSGATLPLVGVDRAFIGVLVPPGEGDVRLNYQPRLFWLGASVSALSVLITLGLAVLSVTRRARHT
jgi:hypothetical protein